MSVCESGLVVTQHGPYGLSEPVSPGEEFSIPGACCYSPLAAGRMG